MIEYATLPHVRGKAARRIAAILSWIICIGATLHAVMGWQQDRDWRRCGAEARTGISLRHDAILMSEQSAAVVLVISGGWVFVWLHK